MIFRFAEMETKLGEIDRARAIYSHASQMCDPRVTAEFWQVGGGQTTPVIVIYFLLIVRCGRTLKLSMETRTHWGRCWGLREASRRFTTHRFLILISHRVEGKDCQVPLKVNMMASAMMADTTGGVGTVADLAPTMTMGLKVNLNRALVAKLGEEINSFFNRTTCGD